MAHVLVVDDSADLRLLLAHVLRSAGFAVTTAESGTAALARLHTGSPVDAVVLDVQMPVLDGWTTLERIREHSEVPVILCTVKSRSVDRRRGWRLGCDGYLAKPFDMHALVAAVEGVVARGTRERLFVRETGLTEASEKALVSDAGGRPCVSER
jgi:two-component system OmpR family response regulator